MTTLVECLLRLISPFVFFGLSVLHLATIQDSENVGTKFASEEHVLDISPSSHRILLLESEGTDVAIRVRKLPEMALDFERRISRDAFKEALFTTDSTLLVIEEDQSPYLLNTSNGARSRVSRLSGKNIVCVRRDPRTSRVTIIRDLGDLEGRNVKMSIGQFDLVSGRQTEWTFHRPGAFVFDAKAISKRTFLLNTQGHPVFVNTKTRQWRPLTDEKGRAISIGESQINIAQNGSLLFFSTEDSLGLATYLIATRQLRRVAGYDGHSYPLLAPDGSFYIATYSDKDSLYNDVSFLHKP
jgi:hypothetical protein